MTTPLFSIITVTYNAERTLPRTLASVREQAFTDYEYIVVDGASSDSTVQLATDAGIQPSRIVSEPDNGLYDAMNKGIDLAKGKYLIFLNAGDTFHSADTLRRIAGLTASEPGIIYGQTDIVDSDGRYLSKRHLTAPEHLTLDSFKNGMMVCHQAFVALRALAPRYDLKWRYSSDYDWCIKCLQKSRHNVYVGAEPIINYLSQGVTSANHRASLIERMRIMSYYYGWFGTTLRHIKFIFRNIQRH